MPVIFPQNKEQVLMPFLYDQSKGRNKLYVSWQKSGTEWSRDSTKVVPCRVWEQKRTYSFKCWNNRRKWSWHCQYSLKRTAVEKDRPLRHTDLSFPGLLKFTISDLDKKWWAVGERDILLAANFKLIPRCQMRIKMKNLLGPIRAEDLETSEETNKENQNCCSVEIQLIH